MKTVLIPVFHGHIARNILRTNVLSELKKHAKVVLIVPAYKTDIYAAEFGDENVVICSAPTIKFSALDKFVRLFYYYFVDTVTVKIIQQEQYLIKKKYLRYLLSRFVTRLLGNAKFLRNVIRYLDKMIVRDSTFSSIFNTYKPDIVFIPSITADDEGLVLREAKKRGIWTVGMVRSWDNITVNKGNIRIFPDRVIAHTDILKSDIVQYADYPGDKIITVGLPHFDYYVSEKRIPREIFFTEIKGDPNKKTIYFMPIGISNVDEDKIILSTIESWIKTDPSFIQTQLIVSTHPNASKKMDNKVSETLSIEFSSAKNRNEKKQTDVEITKKDMELMASAIFHSDVVVNYQSTTTIDSAALGTPIINIDFDMVEGTPYLESVRRFYDFTHYLPILKTGGVKVAHTIQELRTMIIDYLNNRNFDEEGRKAIVKQQVYIHDGNASRRTANAILGIE